MIKDTDELIHSMREGIDYAVYSGTLHMKDWDSAEINKWLLVCKHLRLAIKAAQKASIPVEKIDA